MVAQFRLSRRYVLGVTAAVGGLAMSGGIATFVRLEPDQNGLTGGGSWIRTLGPPG